MNYEVGTKLTLGRVRLNAALYQQDWQKFQFSFLGANSFTEIHNGPNARIRGVEADVNYSGGPLSLTAAAAYTDAKTRQNLCLYDDPTFTCAPVDDNGNIVSAAKGTRLPITPRFKASGTVRYSVPVGTTAKAYGQVNVVHQSSAASDIRTAVYQSGTGAIVNPAQLLGRLQPYTSGDASLGVDFTNYSLEFYVQNLWDERGQLSRFQECGSCGQRSYVVTLTPRTIGIRAGAKF